MERSFNAIRRFLRLVVAVAANLRRHGSIRMRRLPRTGHHFPALQLYRSLIELSFQFTQKAIPLFIQRGCIGYPFQGPCRHRQTLRGRGLDPGRRHSRPRRYPLGRLADRAGR